MDEKRLASGKKLLDAAQEFWSACHQEGQFGAVQWLIGTNGEMVIYTRGEYRDRLMANIGELESTSSIHLFGEMIPNEDAEG